MMQKSGLGPKKMGGNRLAETMLARKAAYIEAAPRRNRSHLRHFCNALVARPGACAALGSQRLLKDQQKIAVRANGGCWRVERRYHASFGHARVGNIYHEPVEPLRTPGVAR